MNGMAEAQTQADIEAEVNAGTEATKDIYQLFQDYHQGS